MHAIIKEVTRFAFWKGNFGSGVEGRVEVKPVARRSLGRLEV